MNIPAHSLARVPDFTIAPLAMKVVDLTDLENEQLQHFEEIISKGLDSFIEVGTALAEIKRLGLFRKDADTFENYLRKKWHMGKSHGYQLIRDSEIHQALSNAAGNDGDNVPLPKNERVLRELDSLKLPVDKMTLVLKKAKDLAGPEPFTHRHIRQGAIALEFAAAPSKANKGATKENKRLANPGTLLEHAIKELRSIRASLKLNPACKFEAEMVTKLLRKLGGEEELKKTIKSAQNGAD